MKILVSRCLMGALCRYDEKQIINTELLSLLEGQKLYFVCPEVEGGLKTPRPPAEIIDGRIINSKGDDVTENFKTGADIALKRAKTKEVDLIILKERSPSCGVHQIYDGTFTSSLIKGSGITADKLIKNGFYVLSDEQIDEIQRYLETKDEIPVD